MRGLNPPFELEYSESAEKILRKMDAREAYDLATKLREFSQTGRPSPKPLTGSLNGLSRLRFDNLRVIIKIYEQKCLIYKIENRDKVYKNRK